MALGKDEKNSGKSVGESYFMGIFHGEQHGKILWDIFLDKLERILQKNTALADGLNILTTRRSKTKNRQ
jgi:hypothetical protein